MPTEGDWQTGAANDRITGNTPSVCCTKSLTKSSCPSLCCDFSAPTAFQNAWSLILCLVRSVAPMPIDSESEMFDHVLGRAGGLDRLFLPIQELFPPRRLTMVRGLTPPYKSLRIGSTITRL